jgi:hypothetical protein
MKAFVRIVFAAFGDGRRLRGAKVAIDGNQAKQKRPMRCGL